MSNNGCLGGNVRDADFAVFDAMPAEIRRAFAEAPYDLAFGDVAGQMAAFEDSHGRRLNSAELGFAVAAIRDEYSFELEATAYALYGAEHPQARIVSAGCLLDLKLLSTFAAMKRWREGKGEPLPANAHAPQERIGRRSRDLYQAIRPLRRWAGAPRRAYSRSRKISTAAATFDPRRDPSPVYASQTAEFFGDPPIGRRAIDRS